MNDISAENVVADLSVMRFSFKAENYKGVK